MKTLIKLITIAFVISSIMACTKDNDNVNTQSNKNLRLKTFIKGSVEFAFSYENEKKLTGFNFSDQAVELIYNNEQLQKIGNWENTYNSINQLTGQYSKTESNGDIYESNVSIEYNNKGRIGRMIVIEKKNTSNTLYLIKEYSYNDKGQLTQILEDGDNSYKTRNILEYFDNGNLKSIKTEQLYDSNVNDLWLYEFTYDDKRNPFFEIIPQVTQENPFTFLENFHTLSFIYIENWAANRTYFFNKNNLLSIKYTSYSSSGDYTSERNFMYTYNEENYPTALDTEKTNSQNSNILRNFYKYVYEEY